MKIKIKILTPVHIGSGEEITPTEYIIDNNKFVRIDMDKLFSDADFKQYVDKFISNASSGVRYIGEIINDTELLKRNALYSIDIDTSAQQYINRHKINVRSFIKSALRVYIPGSSLKGSILSGVIEGVLSKKRIQKFENYEKHLSNVLQKLTGSGLGRFSRWLDVRDSDFKSVDETLKLVETKLVGASSTREMSILYEVLKEGVEFETEIISRCKETEQQILKMASDFYKKVYKKEKEFFESRGIKEAQLPEISENSYILRIGQGSTAWSTSFLILAEKLNIRNYTIHRPKQHSRIFGPPRTRKLVSGTKSMGWVKIRIVNS